MIGVLLLIAGLVLRFNGVTWFEGEDGVGSVLAIVGGLILLVQIVWAVIVGSAVKREFDRF